MISAHARATFEIDGVAIMRIETVLLVDDDADIRRIGVIALQRIGKWRVVEAASADEALALAARESPDVILLDVMMPGVDGPTTYARLRAAGLLTGRVVIFMTAKTLRQEIDALLALGASGVITKPFDPLGLHTEIRAIADRVSASGTAV